MNSLAIVASGPSVTPEQIDSVRRWRDAGPGRSAMAVNRRIEAMPWADYAYACDRGMWDEIHSTSTTAERWTKNRSAARLYGLNWIDSIRNAGLVTVPGVIGSGNNSGHDAIALAWHLGARRIFLVGYDLHGPGKDPSLFAKWITRMNALADDLDRVGVTVINCTPGSALECFPKGELQ